MRKRRGIIIGALFVFTLAAVLPFCPFETRQPVYEGRPLGDWLKSYENPQNKYTPEWQKADEAVRHAGTNAIPTLLRFLRARDSEMELKLLNFIRRQHFITISRTPAATRNFEAARAFQALGVQASNAVPALVKIFDQNISKSSRDATGAALGWLGPAASPAVPALLRSATNEDQEIRFAAVAALNQIHTQPELVVPALTQALSSKDAGVCANAAYLLACYGTDARPAIPALTRLNRGPNPIVRFYADYALKHIEPSFASTPPSEIISP